MLLLVFIGLLLKLNDLYDKYVLKDDDIPPKIDLFGGNGGGINIDSFLIDISVNEFELTSFCIYYNYL